MSSLDLALKELKKPFAPKDVEWRIQRKSKDGQKGMAMAYIDARAISNRLDDLVMRNIIEGWSVSYRPIDMGTIKQQKRGYDSDAPIKGFICTITIHLGDMSISREDGANLTDFEPFKGGLSGAFKRAASMWGIGRYLYDLPTVWVPIDNWGNITQKPSLPLWALPEGTVPTGNQPTPQPNIPDAPDSEGPVPVWNGLDKGFDGPDEGENPFTEDNSDSGAVGDMVFPFGKYKGQRLQDVPQNYMKWCLNNMQRIDPKLKHAMTVMIGTDRNTLDNEGMNPNG